ncbi:MAG: hypothetical protein ACK415_00670, partial [Thermodesulfovibrionales bacterium]
PLKLDTSSRDRLILLRDTITEYPGSLPLYLNLEVNGSQIIVKTDYNIEPSAELIERIGDIIDKGRVIIK